MLHGYSAALAWSAEDGGYVATSAEFPGLSGVSPDSAEAMAELGEAIDMALEAMRADALPLPSPRQLTVHSGQVRLRMPRSLHSLLASAADADGVSLNTLVVSLLARGLGQMQARPITRDRAPHGRRRSGREA